jgi:plastocyanin
MRRVLPATLFVIAATVFAAGCGGSSSSSSGSNTTTGADTTATTAATDSGTLAGKVGPGFDISMDKSSVAAGTYTLTVDDEASIHDFHFTGPGGVDVKTEVSETGTKTFTVDLQPGTYTFVCDPHSSSMHGTLTVS